MSDSNNRLPAYASCSPERAKQYEEETRQGAWALLPWEESWRDRAGYLQGRGYILRPRYQPGWQPSWRNTLRDPDFCEDSIMSSHYVVIDATSRKDGSRISIKKVNASSQEAEIGLYLSRAEIQQDPRNHCVPILDVLPDPLDMAQKLIVMPYLRPFDDPEFVVIGEVVDFVRQTLEGLAFMHSQGVAHRDCAAGNIMMDGRPLYPHGHHPVRLNFDPEGLWNIQPLSRMDHPVKYYFIDFGISSRFRQGDDPLVLGTKGRDKEPPELSKEIPYNPFMLDIYILGNVFRKEFVEKYHGLEFLEPLISSMLQRDPSSRPTADVASMMFTKIRSGLNFSILRRRLRSRKETTSERVLHDTVAAARQGMYHLRRLVA
ncbi:hypothetical protein K474DRAFT_1595284 [Panus rudis PR-1116 ss-1]|nr:hypothetical protein K474DRAFT_1595284 [Panus rudis PR-1116 ss-1]